MIRKPQNHDDGYDADNENELLDRFQENFTERLRRAAPVRVSHPNIQLEFRRLDSLARLLEGGSICTAVYFHLPSKILFITNNAVHSKSRAVNASKRNIEFVFTLVSQEYLSINEILQKLTEIILLNFSQEQRFDLGKLKRTEIELDTFISEWLQDLLHSGLNTREWLIDVTKRLSEDGELDDEIRGILIGCAQKTARFVRDFLKLRSFLLSPGNKLAKDIVGSIRKQRFKIKNIETKGVHAEIRALAKAIKKNDLGSYFGLSKLCCNHCGLALNKFGIMSRGIHGRGFDWPIPSFINDSSENFKKYVGEKIYNCFEKMQPETQDQALAYVSSKDSSPFKNVKKERDMLADSSGSDVEFGVQYDDNDDFADEIDDLSLDYIWQLSEIQRYHSEELERLTDKDSIGLPVDEVVKLYKDSPQMFYDLTDTSVVGLISQVAEQEEESYGSCQEVFEEFRSMYVEEKDLFWAIVNDAESAVLAFSLDEVRNKYREFSEQYGSEDSDGESVDNYALAVEHLRDDLGYNVFSCGSSSEDDVSCDDRESDSENFSASSVSDGQNNDDESYSNLSST